ncbi:hypothetical protein OC846_001463 [Tilletia horrida]|uniref:Importin N-terminal domain-containing protein n=1 Tax=Tilletia horrida TaxID=155126 RepID=A0AAN6GV86_9BASI|nr:hypothetical protein OC846_001463 [Tilletia horrida]KAK0569009.1 hypothetical protein OC861_001350 [Tilletia horrida]
MDGGSGSGGENVLIASSSHLAQALETIEAASRDFNSADAATRRRGEATFLSLRDSDAALEYACFALQHSQDSFVLFQMLGLILQQLPTLQGDQPSGSRNIPSLQHLRDFLLNFVISRAEAAQLAQLEQQQQQPLHQQQQRQQWPQYVRTRAYQLIAAVSKRMLGIQLGSQPESHWPSIISTHLGSLKHNILSLLSLPAGWPSLPPGDEPESAKAFIRAITGLGIFRACLDEFVLTPAGANSGSADDFSSLGVGRRGTGGAASESASNRGSGSKAKQKESGSSVGLTVQEHLLCKTAAQEELLSDLLSAVLHMLVNELQRPTDRQHHLYPHLLFFQLVATLEKILGWSYILSLSLSGMNSASNTQSHARTSSDTLIGNLEDDDDLDFDSQNHNGSGSPVSRGIPAPLSSILLSQDLLRLLSASYAAAQTTRSEEAITRLMSSNVQQGAVPSRAAIDAGREASTALHRLRSCILLASRFEARSVVDNQHAAAAAGMHILTQVPSGKCVGFTPQDVDLQRVHIDGMLELIAGLVSALNAQVQQHQTTQKNPLESMHRGQNILFVVQLLASFASVMESDPERLAISLGVSSSDHSNTPSGDQFSHFIEVCTQLATTVFQFAFEGMNTRGNMDGDGIGDLAESCIAQLVNCWAILAQVLLAIGQHHQQLQGVVSAAIGEHVVLKYIRGRLHAASANVGATEGQEGGDDGYDVDLESEMGSTAEKDRDRFADQLRILAELARSRPDILQPTVEEMCRWGERVNGVFREVAQSASLASRTALDLATMRKLEAKWEETHWLLLMAGYILADDVSGELPSIPAAMEAIDPGSSADHVSVRLIQQLSLGLFETLGSEVAVKNELSSPQVMESLLWFISRWVATYLLPFPNQAGEGQPCANPAINSAMSGSNRSGIIAFLASRLAETVKLWLAEPDVLRQAAGLISGFAQSPHAAAELVALPQFMDIVSAVLSSLDILPVDTHGYFISALVGTTHTASRWAKAASEVPADPEQALLNIERVEQAKYVNERTVFYTGTITQTLEQRLSSAVLRPDFLQVAQTPPIIQAVQTALDMLEGLAMTIQINPAAGIYNFIARFFPTLIQIVETYSERSEITVLVLKVFRTLAISTAWAISEDDSAQKQLNEAVWALFGAIERKRNIIGSTELGAADDDHPYEALCLALETLFGILELTDTGNVTDNPSSGRLFVPLSPLRAEDVGMYGFSVLFPSLTADAFSDPRVRQKLSRVTCTVWLYFPGRVFAVARAETRPGQLANGLIEVLVRLLSADEAQHVGEALDPLRPLAKAVKKLAREERAKEMCAEILPNAVDQLLYVLLRSVLLEPSEDLESHIAVLRPLLQARASPALGGEQGLSTSLQRFCATTPLHSLREHPLATGRPDGSSGNACAGGSGGTSLDGPPPLSAVEENRRRTILSNTVSAIAQACFSSSNGQASSYVDDVDRPKPANPKEAMMRIKEERKAESTFCRVVKANGLLRARRALRIR